jgi:hypothetical protein
MQPMKYGILFSVVAALLAAVGCIHGGVYLLALWPSLSFALVAAGYFRLGPAVYGKSLDGKLAIANQLLLLPYLIYLWSVWYAIRLVKREPAYDQLTTNIFIGRRLLPHELPEHIEHVIDLTSEFRKLTSLRSTSYHSFPILDAFVPPLEMLQYWVSQTAELSGNIYIHCAEGHGRTGLFAAALLLHTGHSQTPSDAVRYIQSKRPLVRLGKPQLNFLTKFHAAS